MNRIFTLKYILFIVAVFIASTALSSAFLSKPQSRKDATALDSEIQHDALIDKALGLSLDGYYKEAFSILQPLAAKDVTRAKLYLAVAYYHGNGVERDIPKALHLFLELQDKNYELGIVNTYLNLIGSLHMG